MARFLIECQIDSTKLAVLASQRADHYEFLLARRGDIIFGGPARTSPEGPPETMVIVVDVADLESAQNFIEAEPYNRSGGFTVVTIRPWSQVLPEMSPGSLERSFDAERATRGNAT